MREWNVRDVPLSLAVVTSTPRGPHDADSLYVERFWLPSIGPSCVMLLRRFARDLDVSDPTTYELQELSLDLGLGAAVNPHSAPIRRALVRLTRFYLAQWIDETLLVVTKLASLSARRIDHLRPPLQLEERQATVSL